MEDLSAKIPLLLGWGLQSAWIPLYDPTNYRGPNGQSPVVSPGGNRRRIRSVL